LPERIRDKHRKRELLAERALAAMRSFAEEVGTAAPVGRA
jgi:hypothetical protein